MKHKLPFLLNAIRWVNISVLVVFFFLGLPALSMGEEKDQLSSYVESFPEGWIDWDNGMIYGVGKGFLKQNNNSKNKSLRAAQVIAQQSVVKVAARIRLNGRQTLETLEKESGVISLKAFIRSEEHQTVFESNGGQPHVKVICKAPLTGIQGLTARLLDHLRTKPSAWQEFPKPTDKKDIEDEEAPWLLLDARQLVVQNGVKPALFPKIISASGETIYDLKTVEEDALTKRGMAKYVVSDMPLEQLSFRRDVIDQKIAGLLELLCARKAYAEEERKKRKRRKFIVTEVAQAQGLMKTNLIISEDDARKVSAEDASSRILKKCRVIIVMSSAIGGVEGSIPRYLAFNY